MAGRTLDEVKAEVRRRAGHGSPFEAARTEDVDAVLRELKNLDRDHWAEVWCRKGLEHEVRGDALEAAGDPAAGDAFYLGFNYCRIGRYPVASTTGKREAYRHSLRLFRKAAAHFEVPLRILEVPFERGALKGYLQVPAGLTRPPVVMHWGGVDGWKEDRQRNSDILHRHGLATLTVDMPGVGECPVAYRDPKAERVFSVMMDHLARCRDVDGSRIGVWGGSFGGYWAAKLAFVEAQRLQAAVIQGGNVHYGFQREWLEPALTKNAATYLLGPSSLLDARSWVLGVDSLEALLEVAPALSLKEQGLLDRPSAPLFAVNGKLDDQAPIEDVYLLLEHGNPKEARVYPEGRHMGRTPGMKESAIAEMIAAWISGKLAR